MVRHVLWWLGAAGLIAVAVAATTRPAKFEPTPSVQVAPASQPAASRPGPPGRRERGESETEVLAVLKDRLPLRYERLMELKASDPQEYTRNLNRMRRWYSYWKRMPAAIQDADIVQQTTSVRIWQLVDQMRQASEADRATMQEELATLAARQFEAETVVMAYRLEMLERALARMREQLAERRAKRDAMVAQRVKHLLAATTQPTGQHPLRRGGGEDVFGPPPGPPEQPGPPSEPGPPDQPPPP
jgi:hypothetical protein